MAAGSQCGLNVLVEAVAHDDHLLWLQSQSLHADGEDTWVGFADAHLSRLHNTFEENVEAKLLEHRGDVAIEVTYEHHRIVLVEHGEHLTAVSSDRFHLAIDILQHGIVLLSEHLLVGIPCTGGAELFHFQAYLHLQRLVESVVGLYDRTVAQRALAVDISVAKLLFGHRHLLPLIGVPEHLSPVATGSVERGTIVKDISFNHCRCS